MQKRAETVTKVIEEKARAGFVEVFSCIQDVYDFLNVMKGLAMARSSLSNGMEA